MEIKSHGGGEAKERTGEGDRGRGEFWRENAWSSGRGGKDGRSKKSG